MRYAGTYVEYLLHKPDMYRQFWAVARNRGSLESDVIFFGLSSKSSKTNFTFLRIQKLAAKNQDFLILKLYEKLIDFQTRVNQFLSFFLCLKLVLEAGAGRGSRSTGTEP